MHYPISVYNKDRYSKNKLKYGAYAIAIRRSMGLWFPFENCETSGIVLSGPRNCEKFGQGAAFERASADAANELNQFRIRTSMASIV